MSALLSALVAMSVTPSLAIASPILSPVATQSGGTLIDFEGQASGIHANDLYAPMGVNFSAAAGHARIHNPAIFFPDSASSGTGTLGVSDFFHSNRTTLAFPLAQSFVEFFFTGKTGNPGAVTLWTFTAFDADDAVLESLVLPIPTFQQSHFVGFARGSTDIRRLSIERGDYAGNFEIDDLRFGSVGAVPEPSSLAVVALGLTLLIRQRRSAK